MSLVQLHNMKYKLRKKKKSFPYEKALLRYLISENYLLNAVATETATVTVAPTIGLLPMPKNPIIST